MHFPWPADFPVSPQRLTLRPGEALSYIDAGEGPPVLMLHGNPTWAYFYRRLIARLSPRHRCIVPDHLGMGASDRVERPVRLADHIAHAQALLDALAINQCDLIVHDWGGAIGMGLATAQPERFRRLVILNTAAFLVPRIPRRIKACRGGGLGGLLTRGANAFIWGIQHQCTVKQVPPAVQAGFAAPYRGWARRGGIHGFINDIPIEPDHPSRALIEQIDAALPTLRHHPMQIHWGMQDWCFSPAFLAQWEKRFPEAAVYRYADAGHLVLEDAAQPIGDAVEAFVG